MGMPKHGGFTLIELMVALAVMAIMLAFAIPGFQSVVNSNRLAGAANELMATLQTARMESLRLNKRGEVCLSANPNAASPSCSNSNPVGWIAFIDADKSGAFNGGDTLLRSGTVSGAVQILSSSNVGGKVIFRSDGMARDTSGNLLKGAIDLCLPTRTPATNVSRLTIMSGSGVSVSKQDTGASCSTNPANPT
jgi:type IV fimbrial biogenesis protein FimT